MEMLRENDILSRIRKKFPKLSKGQKLLANYIVNHYDKAVYLTAAKLGQVVGVSESTVVRFANELGYEGYPKLQRALEETARTKMTSMQRVEVTEDQIEEGNVLRHVLTIDRERIKQTLDEMREDDFNQAIQYILDARRCYIIGVRASAALANFLGFYFNLMFDNVKVINSNSSTEIFENLRRINEEDVLIGITFPRYSKRTLQALSFAQTKKAKVITLTDCDQSPSLEFADVALFASTEMASVVDSLVAPLSVVNAIIVAMSLKRKDRIIDSLEQLENIWQEYQVYEDLGTNNLTSGYLKGNKDESKK
ncbi:MurR/RpiR family transcriptional regulator [Clostridiales bacterium COT073_COT-073]|nr:MurR/RpiR family transcriptional regulator [Clostridiales bacterium COT073_COT-073]